MSTVANDLNTVSAVMNWHSCIITPLVPKPEEFQKERLPFSKEHIEWRNNNDKIRIYNNTLLINLLQANIVDKKVKGQILTAKRLIKAFKEENKNINYVKGTLFNAGIW